MTKATRQTGRILRAPENFLEPALIDEIVRPGMSADRRRFLRNSFLAAGAASITSIAAGASVAHTHAAPPVPADGDPNILALPEHARRPGKPVAAHPYGMPSAFETQLLRRASPGLTRVPESSVAFTPLQGLFGIITPSGLHFERHHHGWHDIDPGTHRLMLHGLVRQPKVYTMDELMRMPSVSRMHFIECGANTAMEWGQVAMPSVQYSHGMLSCSEFTGVPLSVLLDDCAFDRRRATVVLAEGADGAALTRTIPIARALDDVLVAWGMNGEMLRPENGYPLRLLVPGVQGVSSVKWLRRIKVGEQPYATRDEAIHYMDAMPDGTFRQYTSIQECKSVITCPSAGQRLLNVGFYNITGLAWSGRGKIKRVDVSTDGGRNWRSARLEAPVLPKCLSRFNIDWEWDGTAALLQSRAIDETGYVQPKISALRGVRGSASIYHNNAIQTWQISPSGEVANVQVD